jgi:hypothetical protein
VVHDGLPCGTALLARGTHQLPMWNPSNCNVAGTSGRCSIEQMSRFGTTRCGEKSSAGSTLQGICTFFWCVRMRPTAGLRHAFYCGFNWKSTRETQDLLTSANTLTRIQTSHTSARTRTHSRPTARTRMHSRATAHTLSDTCATARTLVYTCACRTQIRQRKPSTELC